jgi:hypothetical protein
MHPSSTSDACIIFTCLWSFISQNFNTDFVDDWTLRRQMFKGNIERDGITVMDMTYTLETSGSNLTLNALSYFFVACTVCREIKGKCFRVIHSNHISNPYSHAIFDHQTAIKSLTGSTKQSAFREADSISARQEFPTSYGTRRFITLFTAAVTSLYPEPHKSYPHTNPTSLVFILTLISHLFLSSNWSLPFRVDRKFQMKVWVLNILFGLKKPHDVSETGCACVFRGAIYSFGSIWIAVSFFNEPIW